MDELRIEGVMIPRELLIGGDMKDQENGFWRSLGWAEWLTTALSFIVLVGVAAILSPGFRDFVFSGETAAWAQAFGTVVAILASARVARWSFDANAKQRKQEKLESDAALLRACYDFSKDAFVVLENARGKFESVQLGVTKIGTERIEEIQQTLRILLAKNIPASSIQYMLIMQREIAYTLTAVRKANDCQLVLPKDIDEEIRKMYQRPICVKEAGNQICLLLSRYVAMM